MNKIVIFYPHIEEYGGIERNIIGLAVKIREKGYLPVLLCYYDRIDMETYEGNIKVVELGDHVNPLVKGLRLQRWLLKHQDEIKGFPIFFSGKAGFYAGLSFFKRFPYVLHFTDPVSLLIKKEKISGLKGLLHVLRAWLVDWLMAIGVRKATLRLTMTRRNANELWADYKRYFLVVYQGGVPPVVSDQRPERKRCQREVLKLFSICRLTYSKNLDWILYAAKELLAHPVFQQSFDRLEVIIAGKGPELPALENLARQLGIAQWVRFPGFLDAQELEEAFYDADLFLVPAKQGFGLPVLEALYRQVPVVQNCESRISEILQDNPWVAISENDSNAFSNAVLDHLLSLKQVYPNHSSLAYLVTEDKWAEEIGEQCTWWSN